MNDSSFLLGIIKEIHFEIVKIITSIITEDYTPKIIVDNKQEAGDVSYNIDVRAEEIIINKIQALSQYYKVDLVMEGIKKKTLFENNIKSLTIIFDPIDGTREIMYDKRSAWILTGISFCDEPNLSNIYLAVQTEIPTRKQSLLSHLFAVKNEGSFEEVYDKSTFKKVGSVARLGNRNVSELKDSFICFPSPFPGTKVQIAKKYERFYKEVFPGKGINDAKVFSDEYISTGGQLYLLSKGIYSIVADIRNDVQKEKNSLCCHPYDLCTLLIPIEAGAIIKNIENGEVSYPLDTTTNCDWVGFKNIDLYERYANALFTSISQI